MTLSTPAPSPPTGGHQTVIATLMTGVVLVIACVVYLHDSPAALFLVGEGFAYARTLALPSGYLLARVMVHHAASLLVFTALAVSICWWGAIVVGRARRSVFDTVVQFGAGCCCLILLYQMLAFSQLLYALPLAIVGVVPAIVVGLRRGTADWLRDEVNGLRRSWRTVEPVHRRYTVAVAVLATLYLPWTLAPPISYDALLYHLGVPAKHLVTHHWATQLNHSFSFHPLNIGFLLSYGEAIFDIQVSKLVLWSLGLLNAALVVDVVGRELGSRRTGLFVAVAYLAMPFVFLQMTMVWIDVAVSFLVMLSVLLLARSWADGERRDFHIAALFAGIAVGAKYTAVLDLAALNAVVVANGLLGGRALAWRGLVRDLLVFNCMAVALASPFFIRNQLLTGNPVFPLATEVFHTPDLIQYDEVASYLGPMQRSDGPMSFWFRMFFHSPFLECLTGPMPLIGIFGIALSFRAGCPRVFRLLGVYALAHGVAFYVAGIGVLRYASSMLLALMILSALVWRVTFAAGAVGAIVRTVALVFSAYLAVFSFSMSGQHTGAVEYSLGMVSKARYLREHLMTSYTDGATFLNDRSEAVRTVLIIGEGRGYYHHNDFIVDGPYMEYSTLQQIVEGAIDADGVAASLHSRGVSHLFVNTKELLRLKSVQFTWSAATLQRYLAFLNRFTRLIYDCDGIVGYEVLDSRRSSTDGVVDEPPYFLDHKRAAEVVRLLLESEELERAGHGDEVLRNIEQLVAFAPRSRTVLELAAAYYEQTGLMSLARESSARAQALIPVERSEGMCGELKP